MKIDRRHLLLPALALGLLTAVPAFALSAEEEAVAKRVEAFRTAQIAQDAKALDELSAPELSYSHSDARVEDKAAFIKNATAEGRRPCPCNGRIPRSAWWVTSRSCGFTGLARAKPSRMARRTRPTCTS